MKKLGSLLLFAAILLTVITLQGNLETNTAAYTGGLPPSIIANDN